MEQFRELSYSEKMDMLDYIAGASREYLSGDGTYADCFYKRLGKNESIYEKRSYSLGLCLCGGGKLAAFCIETEEVVYVDGL